MKQKKVVAVLCTLAMAVSALAGCGSGNAGTASQSSSTAPKQSETSQKEETKTEGEEETKLDYVELDWYCTVDAVRTDIAMIQEALDEYFLEKLNCKVNLIDLNQSFSDTVNTMLLSGEDVDIVQFYSLLGVDYNTLAGQGVFYPMDELWEYGPDVKGMFSDGVWESMEVDGHVYGAPTLRDNAYIMGAVWNDTLAQDLGLDVESQEWSTFADAEDFIMEALKLRNEKYPDAADSEIVTLSNNAVPYFYALEQFVQGIAACNIPTLEVAPEYGTDTVFNFYETDAFEEYVLTMQRLVAAGAVKFDGSRDFSDPYTLLYPAWGYTWINNHLYSNEFETKLKVFDDAIWSDNSCYSIVGTAIGANCKDPERAMMVLNCIDSDPYLATLLRFGIEGEHWEYDADGKMQLTNRNADPSNMGWLNWYGVYAGNMTITNAPESYSGPDNIVVKKIGEYVNDAVLAAHLGFVLDTTSISSEISACSNVIAEFSGLSDGSYSTEEETLKALEQFREKLKANGSDRIIEEVQSQIDAFMSGK